MRDRPHAQHLSWQRRVVDHGSTRMVREDALFVLVLNPKESLTCGGSDWVASSLSWTVASLPLDLSHLAATRLIPWRLQYLAPRRALRARPCHPSVPCPEVTGSGPDLRGNRISYGVAAAALLV
jgi:hypothetical protein